MSLETTTVDVLPVDDVIDPAAETPTADDTETVEDGHSEQAQAGLPRDDRGRFVQRDQAPEQVANESDTDSGEDAGYADDEAAAPGALAPEGEPAPPPATEQPATPFVVRHRGIEYTVQGATVDREGNLHVPPEVVPRIQQMLAQAREAETIGRQREQIAARDAAALKAAIETRHAGIEAVMAAITERDPSLSAEENDLRYVKRMLKLRDDLPQMQAQAERDRLEAENKALREGRTLGGDEPANDDGAQALVQSTVESIRSGFDEMRSAMPDLKLLGADEVPQVLAAVARHARMYVRQATPEDEMIYGTQTGSPLFDQTEFSRVVWAVAGPLLAQRKQASDKQRAAKAAEKARAANAGRVPTAPPPATTARVTSAPKGEDGKITKEQWSRMKGG